MGNLYENAVQVPQGGGGNLDTSLPPRVIWHITWDQLKPDGSQPQFSAVAGYLQREGYCPHLMWNPFTGYIEQYYPADQSARALAAWNQDGAVCIQVEIFFTPGCVVDGVKYEDVSDTPLKGYSELLSWLDSFGIPRVWPLGSPQWKDNSRDPQVWNTQAGHYGHCNVPDNTHTDPGPMPSLVPTINLASTGESAPTPNNDEDEKMLFLMQGNDDTGVWIGDGVVRRAIPNEQTLKDIKYRYSIGELKLANKGEVIKGNVDLCGKAI